MRSLGFLILILFLLQQDRQHLNRRLQPKPVRTLPPLHARNAYTGSELAREVEMTEDFLIQRKTLLVY